MGLTLVKWIRLLVPNIWVALLLAGGCAGSPLGESVQRSLEADSQLAENPPFEQLESERPESERPESGPAASVPVTGPNESGEALPPPAAERSAAETSRDVSSSSIAQYRSTLSDLTQVPAELRTYVADMQALGLLGLSATSAAASNDASNAVFEPNHPISRAQYAQWLLIVKNRFYADQPSKIVRRAVDSDTPVFQDVPSTHPAFPTIQGLAEAGIIPSPLSGSSTTVNFRPDAPLTRQDMVLWKVPLDTHDPLPAATVDAVSDTWGFQDAGKIDPLALRAVLADHQNGEFANIIRAFGFTTLFQPEKSVTQAEAVAALWRFGTQTEGLSAKELQQRTHPNEPESTIPNPSTSD